MLFYKNAKKSLKMQILVKNDESFSLIKFLFDLRPLSMCSIVKEN